MAFKYDFDRIIDRRGMDAAALDCIGIKHWGAEPDKAKPGFSEIPMWVADMNFETTSTPMEASSSKENTASSVRIFHPEGRVL